MRFRRLLVLLVVVGGLTAIVVVARQRPERVRAVFSAAVEPTTPYLPLQANALTTTYFCPGVPASGQGTSGVVVITNPTDAEMSGRVYAYVDNGEPTVAPVRVAARGQQTVDIAALSDGTYVSAMVELERSGAAVEQRATAPTGTSIQPCGNTASESWYFADGNTLDGVNYDLILTNPYPDTASVRVSFATATSETPRTPSEFDGYVIPPRQMRVIDVDAAGARDEQRLSVLVESLRGRVVVGRAQSFAGSGRSGYSIALGAPAGGDLWYFADGETGPNITETYTALNPTDQPVDIDLTVFPADTSGGVLPQTTVTVGPKQSVSIDPAKDIQGGVPNGRHSVIVRVDSLVSSASIVVERALTKPVANSRYTTVVLGSRFTSSRWWASLGVPAPTESALVVANATGDKGTVTVSAVGPGGVQPIPSLADIPINPAGVITIDLTAAGAVGKPIVVSSDTLQLVVEQRYPRGQQGGRTGSLALPE